jgi:hypothetical protein
MSDLVSPVVISGLVSLVVSSLVSPFVLERVKRKEERRMRLFDKRLEEYRKVLQLLEVSSQGGIKRFETFVGSFAMAIESGEPANAPAAIRSLTNLVSEMATTGQAIIDGVRSLRLICSEPLLPHIQEVEASHIAYFAFATELFGAATTPAQLHIGDDRLKVARSRADNALQTLLQEMRRELQSQ